MVRLAALGLSHEANTFAPNRVHLSTFQASGILRGDEIVVEHGAAETTMSGYLAAGRAPDVEVVPLLFSTVTPAGQITADAITKLADELCALLAESGPFDGVLASLHGAAVAEGIPDVDGYLLSRFRRVIGPDVPMGVSLDLHANISAQMCANVDVLNSYHTNPHVDAKERAEEVAGIIVRAARMQVRPVVAFQPVPAAINILCQNTGTPPMSDIISDLDTVKRAPGVLTATVAEGYPYADVPEMGIAVVVVADGDRETAARHARELGQKVWDRREAFDTEAALAHDAIRRAEKSPNGPVLLLDVGDNIGGGSPGDSVIILNAARELGVASLLTIIADSEAAAICDAAGVGASVELEFGAKTDPEIGPPVRATATVLALHSGVYEDPGPTHTGQRHYDAGRTAAVKLDSGQTVVLCSTVTMPASPVQVTSLGLDLQSFKIIVAKGVHSPLAGYGPVAAEVIQVDTPGVTSADLSRFHYQLRRSPLYPFESDAVYPEAG